MLEKLELIDDIRQIALSLMRENEGMDYVTASQEAKIKILGSDINFLTYSGAKENVEKENKESLREVIAKRELDSEIKIELYSEAQLKEMVIASRMGVDIKSFINIFFTPAQIKFITIVSAAGMDITPYTTNLHFDPEVEMKKLEGNSGGDNVAEDNKVKVLEA